jgi:hypothetical protein
VSERTTGSADRTYLGDGNYFRLAYQLLAQQLNQACAEAREAKSLGRVDRERLAPWFETADDLTGDIQTALQRCADAEAAVARKRWPARSRPPFAERRLGQLLETTVQPCVAVAVAIAHLLSGDRREAEQAVVDARKRAAEGRVSYRVHYNLACLESMLAELATAPDADQQDPSGDSAAEHLERALDHLRHAFELAAGASRRPLVDWARKDPSLFRLRWGSRDDFRALAKEFD